MVPDSGGEGVLHSDCLKPRHRQVPGPLPAEPSRVPAVLVSLPPTCVMQPLLQQRLELAHVLKAQIEGFKS